MFTSCPPPRPYRADIKYDASFLVLLNQAKLILAGVSSYYGKAVDGVITSPDLERMSVGPPGSLPRHHPLHLVRFGV